MTAISPPPGYYQAYGGIYLPKLNYKESSARGQQITDSGYMLPTTLKEYIRWQLQQSRRKYFVYHEMYKRDTWIRACIDYVVNRATRDDNRLIDEVDPTNPDIKDLELFLEECYPDGDWLDLYRGVLQDLLEYNQSYIYVERTLGGKPKYLYPLDSRITFPVTDFHGTILFHAQVYNGSVEVFETDEVLYFARRNNGTDPRPVSPMETLIESVGMELSAN
jgi:hypothetical protein